MMIARRTLLTLLGGTAIMGLVPRPAASRSPDPQPFFLILDDISETTPAGALAELVAPFINLGIPAGFIVKPQAETAAWGGAVAQFLRDHLRAAPDQAELVAWVPDLATAAPYFQVRKASAAQARLATFLGGATAVAVPPALTIATEDTTGAAAFDPLRAAGFRNVLALSPDGGATASARCDVTTACMRGGLRHAITEGAFDIIGPLRAAIGAGDMLVLVLSLAGLETVPPETLRTRAAALADMIGASLQEGRIFAALPGAHADWFSTGAERLIGLRLLAPAGRDGAAAAGLAALAADLARAAIPFSLMAADAANPACADPVGPICSGPDLVVQPADAGWVGMDDGGLLHLRETLVLRGPPAADALLRLDPQRDLVISIGPGAYTDETARAGVIALLRAAAAAPRSKILNIPDFAKMLLPADPVYQVMLATRRDLAARVAAHPDAAADRRALMQDARIAWSYFERMHEPATGLCPSTVRFDGAWSSVYRVLTMWDFGSLILGTLAAHELALITDAQFLTRVAAILRALPSARIGGLELPNSEIATHRLLGLTTDYNACDTGRLLSALSALDRYPLSRGACAERVAGWDLAGTLQDGRLQSLSQGRRIALDRSHCAHYAALAFARWGIEAGSPYAVDPGLGATDAQMALLYEVARIGAIGAEPLLMEALEMGLSAPSAYLADVLMCAQIRSHAATGALVCVSEGPMDRAPWFTYQGFRPDVADDVWDVRSAEPGAAFQTAEFRQAARMFSTKAAFLWAASHPGPYADLLLRHARDRARVSEAGYGAGIYAATGVATTNYTDINTNGVILQAIAHILRGRRLRAEG